jgi:eukaryotic-like serine/threonine-protein kinase
MSTLTTEDRAPMPERIELKPTVRVDRDEPRSPAPSRPNRPWPAVGMVKGNLPSLTGETNALRRGRIAAAALFLALCYGFASLWALFGDSIHVSEWIPLATLAFRCVLATAVTALLLSRVRLTRGQVKAIEIGLFGTFTLVTAFNQYVMDLDLLRHKDIPGAITSVKNGLFGIVMLMVIYGMFIPNAPKYTVKVVMTMALVFMVAMSLLMGHPDVAPGVERLQRNVPAGSNLLFLMAGASLAIYGSYVLNGLRTELHEARKFGKYRLREQLGAGGMGEVYLAEHQLLKRPCALKLIKAEVGADPIALARFKREVQSAAQLSHPNTIEIYDYGHTPDGTFYYVMEYLRGLNLAELIHRHGPLSAGRVIYLFRQVCAGLAEAHALGLVHRDLKPANIFVAVRGGESDVAKVLDFGLVKRTRDSGAVALTSDRALNGTPTFMSPEQTVGDRAIDARSDIYGLGATMYLVLTGRPPFAGKNPFAVMLAHARDPVVPPSEVCPGMPADLERVVLRCLAKTPDDRYPDVKALARDLSACAAAADWDADNADRWWAGAVQAAELGSPGQSPEGIDTGRGRSTGVAQCASYGIRTWEAAAPSHVR